VKRAVAAPGTGWVPAAGLGACLSSAGRRESCRVGRWVVMKSAATSRAKQARAHLERATPRVAIVEKGWAPTGVAAAIAATGGGPRRGGRRPVVIPRVCGGLGGELVRAWRGLALRGGHARVGARHAESRGEGRGGERGRSSVLSLVRFFFFLTIEIHSLFSAGITIIG
jgi:hypothetical protein